MRVLLRNPKRYVDIDGALRVEVLLRRVGLDREAHLVIVDGELVPGDALIPADAQVEIRPVISGGAR